MNTEIWIKKARKVHGNKYDYSKSKYVDSKTKIKIICKTHGEFEQNNYSHLKGYGCKKCQYDKYKIKIEDFIARSNKIHNNKYSYQNYESNKIKIICPQHGEFEQLIRSHLEGKGCKKCANQSMKLTAGQFLERANKKHNDKYKYVIENFDKGKIIIICPQHGQFEQSINNHLKGYGCKECKYDSFKYSTNEFVQKARKVHGNKYDYSKSKYVDSKTKIKIICPTHGEFEQNSSGHLKGYGCKECQYDKYKIKIDEFISRSSIIHDNKYSYDLVQFKSFKSHYYDNVIIICPQHGQFEQSVSNHLFGHGCPSCPCIISSGHDEIISFISDIGEKMLINDRSIIKPHELDVYLPNKNIAIEYNGSYWHSHNKKESKNEIYYHYNKYELCKNKGIRLIQINEYEWNDGKLKAIIKSRIRNFLGISNRVYARNCIITYINEKDFMNENHIQKHRNSTMAYGLINNNQLLSCMSFNKYKDNSWEIIRFANKRNHSITGGASKLFKRFLLEQNPVKIVSYADRRYSDGDLYKKLGFELDKITKPGYVYIKNRKSFSRQQFQKHKLKNKLEFFNSELTEAENMFNNGYRRLWDAGHYKFVFKNKT